MRIALGCDHRGLELKAAIKGLLRELGHDYHDFGTDSIDSVDYPDIAKQVAGVVARKEFEQGILICSSGIGMCIAANKVNGIRAAMCYDDFCALRARQHNDANILCLGARLTTGKEALKIIAAFLRTDFLAGRHLRRVNKINN